MEIVYIWFQEYNNLRNLSFNLGSGKSFEYNEKLCEVNVKMNKKFVPGFFNTDFLSNDESIISNVTAIVGENGTGKSSVLDFIRFPKQGNTTYLIIYRDKEESYFYDFFGNNSEPTFIDSETKYQRRSLVENRYKSLFLSNVLDPRIYGQVSNLNIYDLDLSTNSLIKKSAGATDFFYKELYRQVSFWIKYGENPEINSFLQVPSDIRIILPKYDVNLFGFTDIARKMVNKFLKPEILERFSNFTEISRFIRDKEIPYNERLFYQEFVKNCVIYWFMETSDLFKKSGVSGGRYGPYYKNLEKLLREIKNTPPNAVDNSTATLDIFERLSTLAIEVLEKSKPSRSGSKFEKITIKSTAIIKEIMKAFISLKIKFKGNNMAEIPLDNKTLALIDIQSKLNNGFMIANILWTKMSSGQYAMLNLFSRLELAREKLQKGSYSDLLILVDEGDLYFHPQWQKNWLSYFLKGVKIIFKEDKKLKNVQVILTTHSPFVLSDFPDDRVLFLENTEDGVRASNGLNEGQQTFAANIHNLFSNSFFISDGLIGSFAKNKINHLVEYLLNCTPDELQINSRRVRNMIDFIGEPILKKKLAEMYTNKMKLVDQSDIEQQIIELREKVERLERIRGDLQ